MNVYHGSSDKMKTFQKGKQKTIFEPTKNTRKKNMERKLTASAAHLDSIAAIHAFHTFKSNKYMILTLRPYSQINMM